MEIKQKAIEKLERRMHNIEDFIARKGVGSGYLERAKKMQRNVNLAIFVGSVITVAGLTIWALTRSSHSDEEE